MKKFSLFIFVLFIELQSSNVFAFQFNSHENGSVVHAGSTIKVTVDPGDIPPLFGVLLISTHGIVKAKLDSLLPYEWSIKIPEHYFGPLTLWAIGRRYLPIPNPPQANLTLFIVFPAIRLDAGFGFNPLTVIKTALPITDLKLDLK